MLENNKDSCGIAPIPKRYRYKPTLFKNYFKVVEPLSSADRWISIVPAPTRILLTEFEIFGNEINNDDPTTCNTFIPNIKLIQEHFMKEGRLEIKAAMRLIREASDLFENESTLLELNRPITYIGDISGQYYDLLALLKLGGSLDRFNYLFLGNYVGSGYFGTECILHLCALKLNYPEKIFLLRGNHDTRIMTEIHLFKLECELKYNNDFYIECMLIFDKLPLAALIENRFLCLHGGISPKICTLDDIRNLNRFCEPEINTNIFDILWSDPIPDYDTNISTDTFYTNLRRGVSYYYTYNALNKFLENNKLNGLIRGHEMKLDGFKCYIPTPRSSMPSLITIFSAPNYHDLHGNKGTIIQYENCNFTIKQFASMDHPYWFHNYECGIHITLAYIAQKTTDILLVLLMNCVEGGTEDMYMPQMRQNRVGAICCKHSEELNKILDIKEKIRKICKISAFYCNIKRQKLSYMKYDRIGANENDGELKVLNNLAVPINESFEKIHFGY